MESNAGGLQHSVNVTQCTANMHLWQIASSDNCSCGQPQTMNHIVKSCSLTELANDGLLQPHSADHNAVAWQKRVGDDSLGTPKINK